MAYDYITYDEYQAFDPMSKLTDCEFTDLLVPVCRVIDAMLFEPITSSEPKTCDDNVDFLSIYCEYM